MLLIEIQDQQGHIQPMTVADLRKALEEAKPNDPVFLSSDEEGNGFHRLYGVAPSARMAMDGDKPWSQWEPLEDEDEPRFGEVKGVVLWPA